MIRIRPGAFALGLLAALPALAQYSSPVRDVENPDRYPFFASATMTSAGGSTATLATIPTGKRVVLEFVSVLCETAPGDSITRLLIWVPISSNTSHGIWLPVTKQGNPDFVQTWSGATNVKIYAEYSQFFSLQAAFERSGSGSAFCAVKVFGHTVNVP